LQGVQQEETPKQVIGCWLSSLLLRFARRPAGASRIGRPAGPAPPLSGGSAGGAAAEAGGVVVAMEVATNTATTAAEEAQQPQQELEQQQQQQREGEQPQAAGAGEQAPRQYKAPKCV
jgi:hypothetical protein